MMSMRRWLTSKYDFSGLSGLFYRSPAWEIFAIVLAAILTAVGFVAFAVWNGGSFSAYDGENAWLPAHYVHRFDWAMAILLVILLGINVLRMWRFVMKGSGAGIGSYLAAIPQLPYHFFTQAKYRQCERKRPWAIHLALMLSYVTMLVLIMFFLYQMQSGPGIDWRVHTFGYLASIGLIVAVILNLRGRMKKELPQHQHSHESDWMFLYLLLWVAVTGVAQSLLHRSGAEEAANVMYIIHLMGVVPMLVLEVPFGKWAHLAYRPLAVYFGKVKLHAEESASEKARREAERAKAAAEAA
jgi:hypothetical protein